METYSCIIIDDEPYAIESLKGYINAYPKLTLIESYTDPLLALSVLTTAEPVDLILLDIDMPKINGIELSREIRNKTDKLVFTTSHTKYGYEAFKTDADDYLLKPYTLGEFIISMNKLFPDKSLTEKQIDKNDFFFVKSKEENLKMIKIRYGDVITIESKLNYVMIHTTHKKVLTYMSLTEIAKLLGGYPGFLQFQRSFIIAQEHIEYINGNSIRMINGIEITVGEYYKKDFNLFVNNKLVKSTKRS
jgi:two-component system, LytTR family, response regulator LytT